MLKTFDAESGRRSLRSQQVFPSLRPVGFRDTKWRERLPRKRTGCAQVPMFATFAAMERRWLEPARIRARIYEVALTGGRLPSLAELAEAEGAPLAAVRETVALLGASHHVVPGADGELIAAHPFSARPTP